MLLDRRDSIYEKMQAAGSPLPLRAMLRRIKRIVVLTQ
jgi:hypothetical protein